MSDAAPVIMVMAAMFVLMLLAFLDEGSSKDRMLECMKMDLTVEQCEQLLE